jgi:hypothetical protein
MTAWTPLEFALEAWRRKSEESAIARKDFAVFFSIFIMSLTSTTLHPLPRTGKGPLLGLMAQERYTIVMSSPSLPFAPRGEGT